MASGELMLQEAMRSFVVCDVIFGPHCDVYRLCGSYIVSDEFDEKILSHGQALTRFNKFY